MDKIEDSERESIRQMEKADKLRRDILLLVMREALEPAANAYAIACVMGQLTAATAKFQFAKSLELHDKLSAISKQKCIEAVDSWDKSPMGKALEGVLREFAS